MRLIQHIEIEEADGGVALIHLDTVHGRISTIADYVLRGRTLEIRGLQLTANFNMGKAFDNEQVARDGLEFLNDVDTLEISAVRRVEGRIIDTSPCKLIVSRTDPGHARIG
jgi:hypothetical protein